MGFENVDHLENEKSRNAQAARPVQQRFKMAFPRQVNIPHPKEIVASEKLIAFKIQI